MGVLILICLVGMIYVACCVAALLLASETARKDSRGS